MGYIKHNAIIVTDWDSERIVVAHLKAKEIFGRAFSFAHQDGSVLVSDIIPSITNGQSSFFIAPDGSKEGWEASSNGDNARKEFLDWIISGNCFCDYIEVRFGGDDEYNSIVRSKSDDLKEEDYH